MFRLQTPEGPKTYVLRGAQTKRGKKNIAKVSVLDAGLINRVIWNVATSAGLTVEAFPDQVYGGAARNTTVQITTTTAEARVSGASGAVTYSWAKKSGAGFWTISSSKTARTSFAVNVAPYAVETAVFTCTVTDAAGRTATVDVSASAENYGDLTGEPIP